MEDTLKHYGVKGMHWGIRRYQPYPNEKKTVRKANRSMFGNLYDVNKISSINDLNVRSIERKKKKINKLDPKTKAKKIKKLKEKINQLKKDKAALDKKKLEYMTETNKIIKALNKKGYHFSDKNMRFQQGKMSKDNTRIEDLAKKANAMHMQAVLASQMHQYMAQAEQQRLFQQQCQQQMDLFNDQINMINMQQNQLMSMQTMGML